MHKHRISLMRVALILTVITTGLGIGWGLAQAQVPVQAQQPEQSQASDDSAPATMRRSTMPRMRSVTPAQRKAAAEAAARQRQQGEVVRGGSSPQNRLQPRVPLAAAPAGPNAGAATPAYLGGIIPNYANSPIGIRKFVDTLPGLGYANRNNLNQYIPIAVPIPIKNAQGALLYPNDDYYEIGLVDYTQQMHSDLPATTQLRGYVDLNPTLNPATDGKPHYLGPLILARSGKAVRIKFTNKLATGAGGNLFLPVDTTLMGAGVGPDSPTTMYNQNRATLHLHGGNTPWISDGTPHQWITPAGDTTIYKKGVSQQNVPDMPDPGDGSATFYYTNQQSGRLMFYHDHALGMTRLNVYAGEAAGYLVTDATEDSMINAGILPNQGGGVYNYGIPLIIQDKGFVPQPAALAAQDPTWIWGGYGNLWFPHVYMPNQDPSNNFGANPMGRWDYGPWFWPPVTTLTHPPVTDPVTLIQTPATPNPSAVPEAFMDTMLVNGAAYPSLTVQKQAYRFRILNASNDRSVNLQLYYAADALGNVCNGAVTTGCTEVKMTPAFPHTVVPPVTTPPTLPLCALNVLTGVPTSFTAGVPNTGAACWPQTWPTDGRDGGVPDPSTVGPNMIQIGTEGGLLPAPVVLDNTPVGYNYNRRDIVVLNVDNKTLMLGPAERADVIVDFSQVPDGSRLILYNDSPAPVPAFDPRYDYYTGDPDQTLTGGAPTTLAGFGPNTRTIMQLVVSGGSAAAYNLAGLQAAFASTAAGPGAFAASQPPIVVPQAAYNSAYNKVYADTFSRIQNTSLSFVPDTVPKITTPCQVPAVAPKVCVPMLPKAIQELFEVDYGRMNATLGAELPFTNFLTQTTIPLFYIDPPTEIIQDGETQIWKITHNGVDTHAMHFHLFDVQLINRVGWDGAIRPPEPNELGWKDTVRMNPLEDAIVAMRPLKQTLPFAVPDSVRPLAPTLPIGMSGPMFTNVDPATNNPVTTRNVMTNFGWEYVWHCHLLGHEENDMMRPIVFVTPPNAASNLAAVGAANPLRVTLTWKDNSANETGFIIQRATNAAFTQNLQTYNVGANITTYANNTNVALNTPYFYQVIAANAVGQSAPSNVVTITLATPAAPTGIAASQALTATRVTISWTDNSINETGFTLQRSPAPPAAANWTTIATLPAHTGTGAMSTTDATFTPGSAYMYRVTANNAFGSTAGTTPASVTFTTH